MTITLYRKSHRRQPVRLGIRSPFADPQAQIPVGWCIRCGQEVFAAAESLCPGCRNGKGDTQ